MNRHFHCPDAQAFLRLLQTPDGLLAVRSLNPEQEWHHDQHSHPEALTLLERHSGTRALYACLNPVRTDIGAVCAKDEHITALRWFPLDADPKRPTDTASTDEEKAAAHARMTTLLDALRGHLPALDASLVLADSGNGAHALIRLPDYPPYGADGQRSPQWHTLKRLHTALCKRFSTSQVKLDTAVMNPSRIWRIPGTLNVKGANTPERPHRMARLLTPEEFTPAPLDLLAHADALLDAFEPAAPRKAVLTPGPTLPPDEAPAATQEPTDLPPWWNETINSGGRNNAAYRRTRWLLNATEGGREHKDARAELAAWNRACCRPPLDKDELRQTFESAAKASDNPQYAAPAPPTAAAGDVPWPAPLAPEAFHGLAGQIVRAIEPHTEADPAAVLVQLLVAVGSAAGHGSSFTIEDTPHRANLFAVVVGKSAVARKGTSRGRVRGVMAQAASEWATNNTTSGLSSGEGLIHAVRDAEEKQEAIKEKGVIKGYQTVVVDEGVADKRLLVVEGEFAGVLKQTERDGNTLSVVLRNAWDTGTLSNMTKEGRRATGAHISIIGHITAEELKRNLTSTKARNGFANRYLWVCAQRSKLLPFGGKPDKALMAPLAESLAAALAHAGTGRELARDVEADAIWAEVYPDLPRETPGLLGLVITRAGAIVMLDREGKEDARAVFRQALALDDGTDAKVINKWIVQAKS